MIVHINQKQVKLPTGVKVCPEHWDKKNAEEKEIKVAVNPRGIEIAEKLVM